jgi:hypothetical protein
MLAMRRRWTVFPLLLCAAVSLQATAKAPRARTGPEHVRGIIEGLDGDVLTVMTASGSVRVRLAASTPVFRVVRSDRAQIEDGSFLGITSVTDPDGSQRAVEVHVFPEAMRGTGEGSYGWDWPGAPGGGTMINGTAVASRMTNGAVSGSKMTNGTVSAQAGSSSLTLEYKNGTSDGTQTIIIPEDIPVVALEPGQSEDLEAGAQVFVVATSNSGGALVANRVLVGKDGVVPPM